MTDDQYIEYYQMNIGSLSDIITKLKAENDSYYEPKKGFKIYRLGRIISTMKNKLREHLNNKNE